MMSFFSEDPMGSEVSGLSVEHDTTPEMDGTEGTSAYQAPSLKAGTKRSGKHAKSRLSIAEQASDPAAPPMPLLKKKKTRLAQDDASVEPVASEGKQLREVAVTSEDVLDVSMVFQASDIQKAETPSRSDTSVSELEALVFTEASQSSTEPASSRVSSPKPQRSKRVPKVVVGSLETLLCEWVQAYQAMAYEPLMLQWSVSEEGISVQPSHAVLWEKHEALSAL
ncbi:MAG: hypothetical protein ACKO37_01100 [Vampirovibrionales bacterium]